MSDVYSMTYTDVEKDFQRQSLSCAIGTTTGIYFIDGVGTSSSGIEKAQKLLAGISYGAEKAIGSAIKRAALSGETYAARAINKFYFVKVSDFKHYTKRKRRISETTDGTSIDIMFYGRHIPLMKFKTSIGSDGLVKTQVRRDSTSQELSHVFVQTVGKNKYTGLFERVTTKRYPIEGKYGPSVPQMMSANDDVSQAIGDKVRETFDQRIDHEILAVLNGWRK